MFTIVFRLSLIFFFAARNIEGVSIIDINSEYRMLTSSTCDRNGAFLDKFIAHERKIRTVAVDTFYSCPHLTFITLAMNNIRELHRDTFKSNNKLTELHLSYNKLTCIHENLFKSLKNLKVLDLSGNNLETIAPVFASGLNNLVSLRIASMRLLELFAEDLIENFPKLKEVSLENNLLECPLYDRIKTQLNRWKIKVQGSSGPNIDDKEPCLAENRWLLKRFTNFISFKNDYKCEILHLEIKTINEKTDIHADEKLQKLNDTELEFNTILKEKLQKCEFLISEMKSINESLQKQNRGNLTKIILTIVCISIALFYFMKSTKVPFFDNTKFGPFTDQIEQCENERTVEPLCPPKDTQSNSKKINEAPHETIPDD